MSYDFKSEEEVSEFLKNLGIEYRFGCYSEKKPEVCHLLGDYLEAVKKDFSKAATVYRSNCDDYSFGKSCMKYGTYCLLGKGGEKADFSKGFKYMDSGCKNNDPDACFNQGAMLVTNNEDKGLKMDVLKGMELLEKSCDGKNPRACYFLSGMYIAGVKNKNCAKDNKSDSSEYLLKADMKLAHKYALEGCHLGNIYCCANVSRMYSQGEGVEKNEELAGKYKKVAMEMEEQLKSNKTITFQEGMK